MDQQERVVFSIVPILLLILLLRRARRIRFLLTYNYLDLATKESAAVSLIHRRRQILRQRRARRQAWVYPRPQGWFEEMYNNRLLRSLWKDHFRVTRETFDFICQLVERDLQKEDTRLRKAIPVHKRVAIALWRYGCGNSYRTTGITFGIGKSTVIKICDEFTRALIQKKDNFIKFPSDEEELNLAIRRMKSIAGLPNVVGALDGSHVEIKAPTSCHEDYFNRKQKYSINLQGTVDGSGMFIDVSTGWPGSMHDARVLRLSSLYRKATNDEILTEPEKIIEGVPVRPLILGDSAYPLLPWLIGPYPQSATMTRDQSRFNKAMNKSRVVVERAFGKLKCRWRGLLKVLEESTRKVPHTILACCILHNICALRSDEFDHDFDSDDDDDDDDDGGAHPPNAQGRLARQALTDFLANN